VTTVSNDRELHFNTVACGICDTKFTDGTVTEIAERIARHWNNAHGDDLRLDMTPFDREVIVDEHFHGDQHKCRVYEDYITAYDVIDAEGARPFKYEYVRDVDCEDHCQDCWRPIEAVDGYRELPGDDWRDRYLCRACERERRIDRRKEENQQLTEFEA
jgi:hypothetical protein